VQSPVYTPFSISVQPERSRVAVVPEGELDAAAIEPLESEVRELRAAGFDHIVIDLRRLSFIDSSGLRVLLSLRNDSLRDGHRLTLLRGPRTVQRLFELTATKGLFDWRDR
jgi:anti-sigma B factor antagonist